MGSFYSPPASDPTAATPYSDEVSDGVGFVTSSATPVLVTGMTITPPAGTYLVMFTGSAYSDTTGDAALLYLYSGGVLVANSGRLCQTDAGGPPGNAIPFCCAAKITVNGAEAIEGRCQILAVGAANVLDRAMQIIAVGA